ncbi:MAG: 16S rRNA (guanine(527)-N(7))-methyltransferase RsmG [Flavobacteriaceae bacterium]|nr:16S rRNA (guanine(527)-N(7))-methyltransferase RsmG [Flavobacteriaceae bacterium]
MEELLEHFKDLSELQKSQFAQLKELYTEWNSKINIISRKDIDQLYTRHILHSLAIAKMIEFTDGSKIMDVGTGGGFPGIPLAIMFPNCKFKLIDIIGKKIKVVQAIADSLGLKNVDAEQIRAKNVKDNFDFIVSRAVTNMPDFISWVRGKTLKKDRNTFKNGILYLKGGDLTEELKDYPKAEQYNISEFFYNEFFETKKVVYLPLKYKK